MVSSAETDLSFVFSTEFICFYRYVDGFSCCITQIRIGVEEKKNFMKKREEKKNIQMLQKFSEKRHTKNEE